MPSKRKRNDDEAPLTVAVIKKYTVKKLKHALNNLGLATTGKKKELFDRLSAAISSVAAVPPSTSASSSSPVEAPSNDLKDAVVAVPATTEASEEEPSRKRPRPATKNANVVPKKSSKKSPAKAKAASKKSTEKVSKPTKKKAASSSSASSTSSTPSTPSTAFTFSGTHLEVDRALTVQELSSDRIYTCAQKHWSGGVVSQADNRLIEQVYTVELEAGAGWYSRTMALDSTSYLENYLWPTYVSSSSSVEHTISLMLMVNFRIAAGAPVFPGLTSSPTDCIKFQELYAQILQLSLEGDSDNNQLVLERLDFVHRVLDATHCFKIIQACVTEELCSVQCWSSLSDMALQRQMNQYPSLRATCDASSFGSSSSSSFLPKLCSDTCEALMETLASPMKVAVVVKSLHIVVTLLRRRDTRPFIMPLLNDMAFVARSLRSLSTVQDYGLRTMVIRVGHAMTLPISDDHWLDLSANENRARHVSNFEILQKLAFDQREQYPTMHQLSLVTYRTIHQNANYLYTAFKRCANVSMLQKFCQQMNVLDVQTCQDLVLNEETLISMIVRSVLPPGAAAGIATANDEKNGTDDSTGHQHVSTKDMNFNVAMYPDIPSMFNSDVVPLQDVGSPSLDSLSSHYLTWDQYVTRSRHVQSLHLKAMVRSQMLHAIDTNGDDLCDIQEILDLNVRPPAVGTDVPLSVSLDIVVNAQDMVALDNMKRGDVLVLTTIGKGLGSSRRSGGGPGKKELFIPCNTFAGAKNGYDFKTGSLGLGYYLNGSGNDAMEVEEEDDEEEEDDQDSLILEEGEEDTTLAALVIAHDIHLTRLCVVGDVMDDEGTSLFDNRKRHKVVQGGRRTIRVRLSAEQYSNDLNEKNIANYSFRHIILGHRDVQVSYHILHHLKSSLSSSTSATVAAAAASSNGTNTNGGKFCVPSWLRETLVQGKILSTDDEEVEQEREEGQHWYDLGNTFKSLKHLQEYLTFCNKSNALNYEDEDDQEELKTKPALFRTRLLLPSGTIQIYLGDVKADNNKQNNHHHNYRSTQSLNVQQTHAIVQSLMATDQLTLIRGGPGTGKSECVVDIVAALSRSSSNKGGGGGGGGGGGRTNGIAERILILAPTVGCVDRLLSKLERGKHLEPRQIVRVGGSGHGYGNFGPAGRREHCLARQREILKEVSQLSTSLGVTQPGTVFTCETAGHFYNVHVRPRIEQFESSLELQGGANDPFALHYQQKWGNGNGNGLINTSEAVLNRMERLTHLFVELEDYSPFEWMPFARLQMDYLVNSLSTVVGASINGFVQEMDKYEEKSGSGPSFTTIVVDGASHMTDAALAVVLAYNRNRTRRVVLTGDVRSSTVVPSSFARLSSEALYVGAKMNMSLYERLSKDNDSRGESSSKHVHDLMVHHRSRGAITSMYQWRYGSAMQSGSSGGSSGGNNGGGQTKNKKQFANAGLMYPTQFIDVNDSKELSCPQGGYQNIQEAEYIVSVYQYLRLCGHSARSIVILTTYDDQASLVKDVMNLRCVDSSHFSKPSDICTLEQYVGRECDIVLFSLVRTSAIPESIESMTDLINALSRARLGLYIFGDKQLYDNSFSLTPALSKYNNITSKLCLVAGEKNPTKRGVDERGQVGNVCSVENGLHMASVVRMMVGVPLLPGSVMKR